MNASKLALFGGPQAVKSGNLDLFAWPIITREDEQAVLEVLRRGGMSGIEVTMEFEKQFAKWQGAKYALAFNNGTSALHSAMFGLKIGVGDEIICPSVTYWASALPCFSLGATVVFADIEADTLCLDPADIERHITERTKAIVVVHYLGYPARMDAIMKVARKHKLAVIEDVSHAQGGLYQGKKLGTFGDVAAMSLMSGKSFAIGEAGMLTTNNPEIYERAIAFGHYERFDAKIKNRAIRPFAGLPMGGYKYRMHQLSSAVGLVQLKHYDQRCAEIRKAMNYFWDGLAGVPGLRAHRVPKDSNSNMAGWYAAHGLYVPEELEGLSVSRYCQAVTAENCAGVAPGCSLPLHRHRLFTDADIYGHGKPTRYAHLKHSLRQSPDSLPVSANIGARTYFVPWFKHYRPQIIDEYIEAFRKPTENAKELLKGDKGNPPALGGWHFVRHK